MSMLLAAILLVALAPAVPDPAASAAVERARQEFEGGRFAEASAAFAEAYRLDPQRAYVYAQAQAERLGGRCRAAIPLYKRFLELGPSTAEAGDARDNLVRCAEVLANEPPAPPVAEAPARAPEGPAPPADDPRPPRPWSRDALGGVLVATGSAGLLAGVGLVVAATVEQRAARAAFREDAYAEHIARARVHDAAGVACLVSGGVLALAGAVRYAVLARRGAPRTRRVALASRPGGLVLGVRF